MLLWPKLWHLAPWGHFVLLEKAPKLTIKLTFWKVIFFPILVCHVEPTCQRLCVYDRNCDIWPSKPFLPFIKGPLNSPKMVFFKRYIFIFFFYFSHCTYLSKKYVSMTKFVTFGPWGPFCPFYKGPPLNSAKIDIFKNHIHFLFPIVASSIHTKNYFAMPKIVIFGLRTPFLKWAPKRGSNGKFQKSLKSHRTADIETLCAINQVCKSIGMTLKPVQKNY